MQKSKRVGANHYVQKLLPEHKRFERCSLTFNETDKERGFQIGQECFPAKNLCPIIMPDDMSRKKMRELLYHSQHFTVCQNLTFWREQRSHSRNHIF
jgi:hypothetical protein